VLKRAADHAWHGGDRFQNNRTVTITPGEEGVREKAEKLYKSKGGTITKTFGKLMLLKRMRYGHCWIPVACQG
jgi:hypothetical protein